MARTTIKITDDDSPVEVILTSEQTGTEAFRITRIVLSSPDGLTTHDLRRLQVVGMPNGSAALALPAETITDPPAPVPQQRTAAVGGRPAGKAAAKRAPAKVVPPRRMSVGGGRRPADFGAVVERLNAVPKDIAAHYRENPHVVYRWLAAARREGIVASPSRSTK